jgi:nicotinamidase-related amidase
VDIFRIGCTARQDDLLTVRDPQTESVDPVRQAALTTLPLQADAAAAPDCLMPLGTAPGNGWRVSAQFADLVRAPTPKRPVTITSTPQQVRFDASRSALLIVDMQNDFCHPDGWLGGIGVDVAPLAALDAQLNPLIARTRASRVPIIWVNWGNRPDLLNLGPSTLHVYDRDGLGAGLGSPSPNGAPVLELGSWGSAIIDTLNVQSNDIQVAKYSMSGFWDTPLDALLRNLGITTIFFGGVNLDQCVLATLQDASFRGYDCILVEDCSTTSSPDFCKQSSLYNIQQCFGFVTNSQEIIDGLEKIDDATEP